MNEELKQIITGLIIFGIIVSIAMFLTKDNKADLSSDYEEREGQYIDGGSGHPLWNK